MKNNSERISEALPAHTLLTSRYEILETLGKGGFAITYKGNRKDIPRTVAIKEYFPAKYATRSDSDIIPLPSEEIIYARELERFLSEAAILEKFDELPCIAKVIDCFKENNTAYIVMEYIEGPTLDEYVRTHGAFSFDELLPLIEPVLDTMERIHGQGLVHRDLSPDNIIISLDGTFHIIDFGAAGYENTDENPTIILKAGYAPPEQYIPGEKPAPWTDVYAICATMLYALTGKKPVEALKRMDDDRDSFLSEFSGDSSQITDGQSADFYRHSLTDGQNFDSSRHSLTNGQNFDSSRHSLTDEQINVLRTGMALRPSSRYQNMRELNLALHGKHREITGNQVHNAKTELGNISKEQAKKYYRKLHPARRFRSVALVSVSCVCVFAISLAAFLLKKGNVSDEREKSTATHTERVSVSQETVSESVSPAPSYGKAPDGVQKEFSNADILYMKNLKGLTFSQAKKVLRKLDQSISVTTIYEYGKKASGIVMAQSVKKGTSFTKGSLTSILLTISKGRKPAGSDSDSQKSVKDPQTNKSSKKNKSDDKYKFKPSDDYTHINLGD